MYNEVMKKIGFRRVFVFSVFILAVFGSVLVSTKSGYSQSSNPRVLLLTSDGPLTPVLLDYLKRGMGEAERGQYNAIILQLNTPGGSIDLMNKTVTEMRASKVPIIVYVAPRGAMAGSAGTIITMAGHAAAMAPETAIGAASPVGGSGEDIGVTMEAKVKEMLKATARSLVIRRGEKAIKLAEDTIQNAKAVSGDEALAAGLIDVIAKDPIDLLHQLDGRTVELADGPVILDVANATVQPFNHSLIEELLTLLINPNLVFILLAVGAQAILIEISSPGGWVAGFLGVCCIALAVYGMGILPVNLFGIIFMVIAFVLYIMDINAPTHGLLTLAGTGSFIVGALVLFNGIQDMGFPPVSIPLVIGTGVAIGGLFFGVLTIGLRAQHKPVSTGREMLVGKIGTVVTDLNPQGEVQVAGERWTAFISDAKSALPIGSQIVVTGVEGIRLQVKAAPDKLD
jgi:membrane-bound serine protease (ClpP class)